MTESEWLASTDPQAMLRLASGRVSLCCGCLWCDNGNGTLSLAAGQKCCEACDNDIPEQGQRRIASERKLRLFAVAASRLRHPLGYLEGEDFRAYETAVYAYAEAMADDPRSEKPERYFPYCEGLSSLVNSTGVYAATSHVGYLNGESHREVANILRDIVGNPFRPVTYDRCCGLRNQGAVIAIASAAYEERPGRKCERCKGTGKVRPQGWDDGRGTRDYNAWAKCNDGRLGGCHGTGCIEDGNLDPVTLAILADALEDAGCDNEDILRHLRGYRPCQFCCGNFTDPPERHAGAITGLCVQCLDDHGWERLPGPHVRGMWSLDLILGKE